MQNDDVLMSSMIFPSLPLPDILINSDDYDRVMLLAERSVDQMPYVSAYLERELHRAELCAPWDPAGVSMGQRVLFQVDDQKGARIGRLVYPNRPRFERGTVPILGAIGAALIGMKRKATIEWLDGGMVRTLKVLDYGW